MKNIIITLISIFVLSFSGYSQGSFTVSGLADGKQWQIIEKGIYESGYKIGEFNPAENYLLTNWIQWKAMMIENRGLIKIELSGQDATISMVQRSYKTKDGWDNAIGKLSKKNKKKYLQSLVDKITAINASEEKIAEAVENSILFPIFKPVYSLYGVEWKLDSTYQENTSKKRVFLFFSITNTNSNPVDVLVGQSRLKVSCNDARLSCHNTMYFKKTINPGETVSCKYELRNNSEGKPIVQRIQKFDQSIKNISGKDGRIIFYDIKIPYYSK